MTENEKDILLLQTDPNALIMKYQRRIRFLVEQYVQSGMFSYGEMRDIVQSVNEGLLQRIPTMLRHYDRKSLLVTYLSTIVRNICLALHKESKVQYEAMGAADVEDPGANQVLGQIAIEEALAGLHEVLELYHREKPRLIILLRLHFKIPLDERTILLAYPGSPPELTRTVLKNLGTDLALKEERELFSLAAPFLNAMEQNSTSGDGYEHWLRRKITEILLLLRTRLGIPGFDREALGTLFEAMTVRFEDQE